jgi:hypothetical protein
VFFLCNTWSFTYNAPGYLLEKPHKQPGKIIMLRPSAPLMLLAPPRTPAEAVLSRRNPCYGFTLLADIQEQSPIKQLLEKARDQVLEIVDPERPLKQRPIRSPLYIKQKFFHAAVFGMQPLLDAEQFIEIYANDLLNQATMEEICDVAQTHLRKQKPFLMPVKFEMMNNDGTILARFAYKTSETKDEAPLLSLTSQLDPNKKFAKWDSSNQLRYTTVTAAICVIDKDKMPEKLESIQKLLATLSEELINLGRIEVTQFRLIHAYNKRTLSLKHTSTYATITEEKIERNNDEKKAENSFRLGS